MWNNLLLGPIKDFPFCVEWKNAGVFCLMVCIKFVFKGPNEWWYFCLCGITNFGQTRVVQITQQLSLETEDSLLASRFQDKKSSTCQLNNEVSWLWDTSTLVFKLSLTFLLYDTLFRNQSYWNLKGVKLLVCTLLITLWIFVLSFLYGFVVQFIFVCLSIFRWDTKVKSEL